MTFLQKYEIYPGFEELLVFSEALGCISGHSADGIKDHRIIWFQDFAKLQPGRALLCRSCICFLDELCSAVKFLNVPNLTPNTLGRFTDPAIPVCHIILFV